MQLQRAAAGFLGMLPLLLSVGCATQYTLRVSPTGELIDGSSVATDLAGKHFKKFIIVPSSGVARGEYEQVVATLEKELLHRNVRLISSAVSGRIVEDKTGAGELKNEAGRLLSDTERLFVMAKKSRADAILQIGKIYWEQVPFGLFILDKKAEDLAFVQATPAQFEAWTGPKIALPGPVLRLTGKVMDVESGEIVASLSISSPASSELTQEYVGTYKLKSRVPVRVSENFRLDPGAVVWDDARRKAVTKAMNTVARRLLGEKVEQ